MNSIQFVLLLLGLCAFAQTLLSPKRDTNWWRNAVVYQIYPRSFKDSDNDGIGDLQGITSKLEYLKNAGISSTWLSPIYKSPQVDTGYDISDFRDIQEEYGTMEDFENMVARARELGIRIIMDLVPNHSSDQHEWFIKSANLEPGYENYYIWLDGRDNNTRPPNNWVSVFSGSAWTFHPVRQQWYFHQFAPEQPDLNFRDPRVVQEMKDIITFWMDKGVSGFRVDAILHLFETEGYPDEPLSNDPNQGPDDYGYLRHDYTRNQPETYDMVYQWRQLLDEYDSDEEKIMMVEAYENIYNVMAYYGNATLEGCHFPFNFMFLTDINTNSSAEDIVYNIQGWMTYMPRGKTANWVLGNHDNSRVASRFGVQRVDGLNMLHLVLPGVKVVYNGEEIGMEDGEVSFEQGQDPTACNAGPENWPQGRDPERTPFHWDGTVNAGFNEGAETWLPVSEKYRENNLEMQNQQGVDSHYHVFQRAVAVRNHRTFIEGDLIAKAFNSRVVTLKRELPGSETFVFALNIGDQTESVDLRILGRIPNTLLIEVASSGSADRVGTQVNSSNLQLRPYEALILVTESPVD